MSDLDRVIVGNVVVNPHILREFLKKSHYFMSYDSKTETIRLSVNDGTGGKDLLFIRNASYENAAKMAEGLGLKADLDRSKPLSWSKWNPVYPLYHDGSEDAEKLRMEMLKLGLPFRILGPRANGSWGWHDGMYLYSPPMWSVQSVLNLIRGAAERYKERLTTTP